MLADIVEIVKHIDGGQLPPALWNVVDSSEMLPLSENSFSYYCRVKGDKIPDGATLVSYEDGESSFTLPKMREAEFEQLVSEYEVAARLRFLA